MIMCGNGDDKMKFSWIIIFVLLASMVVATEQYYEVEIEYSHGNFTMKDLNVIPLTEDPGHERGDIVVALLNKEKKVLDLSIYPFSTLIYVWDENGEETVIDQEEFMFTVHMPYQEASLLVVYDENLTSLVRYSFEESSVVEEVPIPDLEEIEVEQKKNYRLLIIFVSLVVLLFLILFVVLFVKRKPGLTK